MRHFKLAYISVLFLTLPLLSGCDQTSGKNSIIGGIMDALEAQKQEYFEVNFQLIEPKSNQAIQELTAIASLKTGEYGNISKAYFTIGQGGQLHYLQTISDLQSPIFLLESNELDQNKAANVYDSINSPVKLHPGLLREWLAAAHHVEVTDDQDNGIIDVELQLVTQAIRFSWDNKEHRIDTLEVLEADTYSYKWNFKYLTEATFEAEGSAKRLTIVNQNEEFL